MTSFCARSLFNRFSRAGSGKPKAHGRPTRAIIAAIAFSLLLMFSIQERVLSQGVASFPVYNNLDSIDFDVGSVSGTISITNRTNASSASGIAGKNYTTTGAPLNFPGQWYTPSSIDSSDFIKMEVNNFSSSSKGSYRVNIDFGGKTVVNPVVHFVNLDAASVGLSNTVTSNGTPISSANVQRLSGNNRFTVASASPFTINSTTPPGGTYSSGCQDNSGGNVAGACGSVRLVGSYTSIVLTVTDNNTSTTLGDGWGMALSIPSDYGDAPVSYGEAAHLPTGIRLGTNIDTEDLSQPSTDATLDDATGTPDDEDSIAGTPNAVALAPGGTHSQVVACTGTGFVRGFIDFNRDGDFADAGENSAQADCTANSATLNWTLPTSGLSAGPSFLRVRAAAVASEITSPTGTAASGEVEDYAVTLNNVVSAITLKKIWVNPIPNDTVNLTIGGATTTTAGGTSRAGAATETSATATAIAGAALTLTEAFTTGSAGNYTTNFACTLNSNGSTVATTGSGLSRAMTMPGGAVTCTVTNSRPNVTGSLPPAWTTAKTCPAANPLSKNSALQVGWNHNTPQNTPNPDEGTRIDFPTADPVVGGPGITYTPTNTAGVARLVDTQTAAAANAAGDYVSYHVRTGATSGNRALQSIRWGINNEAQWVNGYPYKFTVLVSNDPNFATAQTIISDEQSPFTTAGPYQEYTRNVAPAARILLQPNTDYYFRVLLYATNAQPTDFDTAIWDDFAINTADCETQSVQLAKTWSGATAGHQASATTTGAMNTNATFASTAPTATTGTAVSLYKGETITLPAETFAGGATAAMYNSTVSCTGGSTLASGAVGRTLTIANSDTATVCTYSNVFTGPLKLVKTSMPYWDPSNLFTNPKMIPGAYVNYTLTVDSPAITVTSNSVIVTDALPPQVSVCVVAVGQCSAPVTWNVGHPVSLTPLAALAATQTMCLSRRTA